jgi:hypothetical protein
MLEQLQGEQDADGHGPSTARGLFGKSSLETLLDGADESRPGKGVSPLTDGMHDGDKIHDLQAGPSTAQPMLEITNKAHRRLSSGKGGTRAAEYDKTICFTSPNEHGKKLVITI